MDIRVSCIAKISLCNDSCAGFESPAGADRRWRQGGLYLLDELNAQHLYNAARNVAIAAWKLANARNENGEPLLYSNEIGAVTNLSFEREFGRVIGQLEVLSEVIEQKTERAVLRVVQSLATAVFLPVH